MTRIALAIALAVTWPSVPGAAAEPVTVGTLQLFASWARATPVTAVNGAIFLEIRNTGAESDWLIAAASPVAHMAGIHETTTDAGVMRMRAVEMLEIPGGGSVQLKPGGLHIMLMKLAAPLVRGGMVPVTLDFAKAGRIDLVVPVAGPGAMAAPQDR